MKFDFQMNVKGMSKIANGVEKKFEGADINCSCEANVGEVVEFLKNSQLSLDKLLTFVKVDMPNTIRENGKACLDVVKEERILDNEMPRQDFKKLIEENKSLQKELEEKSWQLKSAMADCNGTSQSLQELQEKFNKLQNDYNWLRNKWNEENSDENDHDNEYTKPQKKIF